jgi:histidinol-phosphate aminotransferase
MTGADSIIHTADLESVLAHIRPAIREQHINRVPSVEGIEAKLKQNEIPFDVPDAIKQALAEQFATLPWNRYPDEFAESLRVELGASLGFDSQGILFGNGSNELTYLLGLALIEKGTPVVLLEPMFSLYKKVVQMHEGIPISVSCNADFTTDVETVLTAIHDIQAPLVILTTPNNPTGQIISLADIERIATEAPGVVVIDEAYYEFLDGPNAQSLMDRCPNLILLRTFSKAAGLAGLRLGYLMAHPVVLAELSKARLPFMINQLTVAAAHVLLKHPTFVAERVAIIKAERDTLFRQLSAIPHVDVVPSYANFLIFKTPIPSPQLVALLADRGVLIRDVSSYQHLMGYVRVNAGLPSENHAFISALKGILITQGYE